MGMNENNQKMYDSVNYWKISEVLRYNSQNKTRYLCWIAISLHCTLWNGFKCFIWRSRFILLFIFSVSFCPFSGTSRSHLS